MTAKDERAVFEAALELPREQREAFLERTCAGDVRLAARVRRLVEAHERAEESRTAPPLAPLAATAPDAVGPYRILEEIGAGGMGVVYLAEQTAPIRRRVALKVVRAGLGAEETLRRFHAEREALARMEHPNIARILDSGTTEDGLPYFVMELVRGEPVLGFCDSRKLEIEERLRLIVTICRAVQHAHTKAVVHRDLKPSNVLVEEVDGKAVPKVIDFGISRLVDGDRDGDQMVTRAGAFVGTPAYMSPEQVDPDADVDTRSDVYSLGVLLYELLTGALPVAVDSLKRGALHEAWLAIREETPRRPSLLFRATTADARTAADLRGATTTRLASEFRGDLDWIVMKALEKAPDRRYETAEAFARDIERYLADEPIVARPPSRGYVARKFVRRHRGPVAAASILVAALVAGTVGTSMGLVEAGHQRSRAEERATAATAAAARATAARDFLIGIVADANPLRSLRRDARARDLLERAAERLDSGEFDDDPDVELELRATLGEAFRSIDLFEAAERQFVRAVRLLPDAEEVGELDALALRLDLGRVRMDQGDWDEGRARAREALEELDRLDVGDHSLRVTALTLLSRAERDGGHFAAGEAAIDRAAEICERLEGPVSERLAQLKLSRVGFLNRREALEEALAEADAALTVLRHGSPRARVDAAKGLFQRGHVLHRLARRDEAKAALEEALEIRESLFDPGSTALADVHALLGEVELSRSAMDSAEEHIARALDIRRELLGAHVETAQSITMLAALRRSGGDIEEAIRLNEEALEMRRSILGESSAAIGDSLWRLGDLHHLNGDLVLAEDLLRESIAEFVQAFDEDHPDVARSRYDLGELLRATGRYEQAAEVYDAVLATRLATLSPTHPKTRQVRDQIIMVQLEQEAWDRAEQLIREALEIERAHQPGGTFLQTYIEGQLGVALAGRGAYAEAEPLLLAGWKAIGHRPGVFAENKLLLATALARLYDATGDATQAEHFRGKIGELADPRK